MGAFQNEVFARVDERFFAAGIPAPEQKDEVFLVLAQKGDDGVGKPAPAAVCVRICLMRAHRERRVHQQDALFCPFREIARLHDGTAQIVVQFLHHVFQRRGLRNAVMNGETKAVCLSFVVVGVLPQKHRFHVCIGRIAKAVEDVVHIGVDDMMTVLLNEKGTDFLIALVLEERGERLFPIAEIDHKRSRTAR